MTGALPGLHPAADLAPRGIAMATGVGTFDRLTPILLAGVLAAGAAFAILLTRRAGVATRRVPTWGCGGELTARTEYTATAFSKPLMMIFGAVYRPTRDGRGAGGRVPLLPARRCATAPRIEPTFERYVYGPLLRAVLRVADGMKVLQAGSLHAYLAYVIALVVTLVLLVWWRRVTLPAVARRASRHRRGDGRGGAPSARLPLDRVRRLDRGVDR